MGLLARPCCTSILSILVIITSAYAIIWCQRQSLYISAPLTAWADSPAAEEPRSNRRSERIAESLGASQQGEEEGHEVILVPKTITGPFEHAHNSAFPAATPQHKVAQGSSAVITKQTAATEKTMAKPATTSQPKLKQGNETAIAKPAAVKEETIGNGDRLRPTVFYNMFLGKTNSDLLYEVVREQLKQLGKSYAASSVGASSALIQVMYTTIGVPFNHSSFSRICSTNRLECKHLGHHDKGHEMITLQSMLDYCKENPTRRVIYLHPKGSFHVKNGQDEWRRDLTDAATSQPCTNPPDSRCNLCGLDVQPTWGPLILGNMFQAKCSYVAKLFSPYKVETKMKAAYDQRPANLTANLYAYAPYTAGKSRYAAEVYIGNHPDLFPCDVSGRLSPATVWPSHNATAKMEWQNGYANLSKAHAREWFLLGGLLWKYHLFYNMTPPATSWVWWYFPAGRRWQKAVKRYGMPDAIYSMARSGL